MNKSLDFEEFKSIITELKYYAKENLFVVKNSNSGLINMNVYLPLKFKISDDNSTSKGELIVALLKPTVVSENVYNETNKYEINRAFQSSSQD